MSSVCSAWHRRPRKLLEASYRSPLNAFNPSDHSSVLRTLCSPAPRSSSRSCPNVTTRFWAQCRQGRPDPPGGQLWVKLEQWGDHWLSTTRCQPSLFTQPSSYLSLSTQLGHHLNDLCLGPQAATWELSVWYNTPGHCSESHNRSLSSACPAHRPVSCWSAGAWSR